MKNRLLLLATALLATAPLDAKPAARRAAVDNGIYIGQILVDANGKVINGWQSKGGAMYQTRPGAGLAPGDAYECCIHLFQKGSKYIVARTVAVERASDGGVIKERVAAMARITAQRGEEETTCEGTGSYLALSLKNERSGMVRSIVVSPKGELSELLWKDSKGLCGYDG